MQITVPNNLENKPLRIDINGVAYLLSPGETINVPDAVCVELARMLATKIPGAPPVAAPFEDPAVAALEARVAALEAGGGVPAVATEDKGKFLHANESTGALEWETAGGGPSGGVLIVHNVYDDGSVRLDATYADIAEASMVFLRGEYVDMGLEMDYSTFSPMIRFGIEQGARVLTFVSFSTVGSPSPIYYFASSDSDYPVLDT